MHRSALSVEALSKSFASTESAALQGVSLEVRPGHLFCLLGPSGCGKTTLLKIIGGYLRADSGSVRLLGRDLTDLPPEDRRVGTVFQSYALFPHMTALENVAFGLESRGVPRAERLRRASEMLDKVSLSRRQQDRKPRELSGGQQQRVALARVLVFEPELMLLDEPMANLDKKLKDQMRFELKELQQRVGITTVLVTHDQEEALSLGDEIGVMRDGKLLQVGAPAELYRSPQDAFVGGFLGEANLFPVESAGVELVLKGGGTLANRWGDAAGPGKALLVRPEDLEPDDVSPDLKGVVQRSFFFGAYQLLHVEWRGQILKVRFDSRRARERKTGDAVGLKVRWESAHPVEAAEVP